MANDIALNPLKVENGTIALPTEPGIGIDLEEAALAKYPYRGPRNQQLRRADEERP